MAREGTYSDYWQNAPRWSLPVGDAFAMVDLSDVARAGGSAILPGISGGASLVAGTDLTLNGAVRANGAALTGSWKRGEVIQALGSGEGVAVTLDASVMDCANGFLCLVKGYKGKLGPGLIPPGNGTLDCAGVSGPIGRLLHFAFIDESSTYRADESLRQEDLAAYAAAMQDVSSRYVVLFQLGPTFTGPDYEAVLPGPPEVKYERIQNRPAPLTSLVPQFNQGLAALAITAGTPWWMSFSIDNSGSMSDADVREAVDSIIARAQAVPGARVAETYGSGTERWIQDIVIATEEIRAEIALETG